MSAQNKFYAQTKGQGFIKPASTIRKTYKLDDRTGRLLETGEEDIEQLVQSGYTSCLDYVVDRFLESGMTHDDIAGSAGMSDNQDFLLDALDLSADYVDMMEEARELYGLSPDLTYSEVREKLKELLDVEQKKFDMPIEEVKDNGKNETQTPENVESPQESQTVS